jgi:diguanylate cyclase (GGDEF)-like protein/PAS domain S-box-containing protein
MYDKTNENAVLVVDDTPENIRLLRRILAPEGYRIRAAVSGSAALDSARHTPPDIILLDVMMPDMSGFDVCRRLKDNELTREIPVIFVTGRNDSRAVVEGFAVGAVDYLTKPVQSDEVCARLRSQLRIREQVRALREQAERFRAVVSNMAEGLLILESDGRIQLANPAATRALGYEPGQLEGLAVESVIGEPARHEVVDYLQAQACGDGRGGAAMLGPREAPLLRGDGAELSMDLTVTPMFVTPPLFIGLLHDISRHKLSHDELLRIACTDPLTGIANRRRLDAFMEHEWRRAARGGSPVSLVMIDVDHFKLFNDRLGHPAGDRCLQRIAQLIENLAKRPTDLAARYGGEEFALVLAGTEMPSAQHLAEVLRQRIEALRIPHPASSAGEWVTASLGVATRYPGAAAGLDALLRDADAALYQAKAEGRNRVFAARDLSRP